MRVLSLTSDALVSLKIDSSEWSVGMVDLNAVGSFDLLLPSLGGRPEVVHVEIGLAPPSGARRLAGAVRASNASVR